jgi:hypothetical protein
MSAELPRPPRRQVLAAWLLACLLAGATFTLYAALSLNAGAGGPVMPVDDAYIHFQYARQIAVGQFYIYNPGGPPTSGATSFLYPYLLAFGHLLGFRDLWLGLWAMLLGALALLAAGWAVYRLIRRAIAAQVVAVAGMAVFMTNGLIAWHFMSGMETGLMVAFALLTLYGFAGGRLKVMIAAATLLTLTRPEGGLMAGLAVALWWLARRPKLRETALLALPILAIGLQPLVNLIVVGSAAASGGQAKSLFGIIPPDPGVIWGRILENYARFWAELLTGLNRDGVGGMFILPPLLGIFALAGLVVVARRERRPGLAVLVLGWWLGVAAAIATLDTAFWHFKRYQMPLLALCFPLAAWAYSALAARWRWPAILAALTVIGASLLTGATFWRAYAVNIWNVAGQPLAMARWLAANTSADARVAVHDVGTTRYVGGRTTLDMVGLTTPGAAEWWRNGPGAVGEYLLEQRPDTIAAYTGARGLNYLADTPLYGERLAAFRAPLFDPTLNVALGGPLQGVFAPDWAAITRGEDADSALRADLRARDLKLIDTVNVAHLESERAHAYAWFDQGRRDGFATEFYALYSINPSTCEQPCMTLDGGRRINGEERFTIDAQPGVDLVLVTRVHPVNGGRYHVYAGDQQVATRTLFAQPGQWLEIPALIPGDAITQTPVTVRIVAETPGGHYMPYHHWLYQGEYFPELPLEAVSATFQEGAIALRVEPGYDALDAGQIALEIDWYSQGRATGDAKLLIHVYADPDQPPVAQADLRPGQGALPPGNWLPGRLSDDITLDVATLPPGTYTLAIGLYDPVTGERFAPQIADPRLTLDEASRRIFVGTFDLPASRRPGDG